MNSFRHLTVSLGLGLAALTAAPATSLAAGTQFYVSIEGTKQGKFKGEAMNATWKDSVAGMGFDWEVTSPRDLASGQASGKRQHRPMCFSKEFGAATPQIFQALVTNEVLKKVTFSFVRPNANGQETVSMRFTLANATVSDVKYFAADDAARAAHDSHPSERVCITYEKIDVESLDGKTMATDNWRVN